MRLGWYDKYRLIGKIQTEGQREFISLKDNRWFERGYFLFNDSVDEAEYYEVTTKALLKFESRRHFCDWTFVDASELPESLLERIKVLDAFEIYDGKNSTVNVNSSILTIHQPLDDYALTLLMMQIGDEDDK